MVTTGPPIGPVLFCLLASVVCNAAGGPATGWPGGQAADTARWRWASTFTTHYDDTLFIRYYRSGISEGVQTCQTQQYQSIDRKPKHQP